MEIDKRKSSFVSYEEAKKTIHLENLKSQSDWVIYSKSKRPTNIPSNPSRVYKNKGWVSWGDWLGTGRIADQLKVYLSFTEAKKFVHTLKLNSQSEWFEYCKTKDKLLNLPTSPSSTYKKDWVSWGDWLGTNFIANKNRKYISFENARKFVRKFNFKTRNEWNEYTKSGNKPDNIPSVPEQYYKNKGWISWSNFLGSESISSKEKNKNFLIYNHAKKFVNNLNFKTTSEWWIYVKSGLKPDNIPSDPADSYKNRGWISWGDFLRGELDVEFLSFDECRDFVHKLNLKSWEEWIEYVKSGNKPKNVPSNPAEYYKNKNI